MEKLRFLFVPLKGDSKKKVTLTFLNFEKTQSKPQEH